MNNSESPIRVLHVLTAMNRAGTETLLMNYYRSIDTEKLQFDFAVSCSGEGDYDKEIIEKGGKIYHYPKYTGWNHFKYKKFWKDFFRQHPEYKIVHGHIGSTASIYLKIAKKFGCFTIAHSHNVLKVKSLQTALYRIYAKSTRKIADYFMGCSKDALIDRYGSEVANDKARSTVLKNAIDAKKFIYSQETRKAVREELNIDEDTFVVGTVGRLSQQKNPQGVIEIIKLLNKSNKKFKFIWTGGGELETQVKQQIHEAGLEQIVIMTGVRNDVNRIMQAMDVFVFPSLYEGLGNVLVEAQAAGLPSFCSDTVPKEAKISDLLVYLPLNNYQIWVDEILNVDTSERKNMMDVVVNSGYDIQQNANYLQEFYLNRG